MCSLPTLDECLRTAADAEEWDHVDRLLLRHGFRSTIASILRTPHHLLIQRLLFHARAIQMARWNMLHRYMDSDTIDQRLTTHGYPRLDRIALLELLDRSQRETMPHSPAPDS